MMETQGLPPVVFPPQNDRDRQHKRERDGPKSSEKEAQKPAPQDAGARLEEGIGEEKGENPVREGQEGDDTENRVDIRI